MINVIATRYWTASPGKWIDRKTGKASVGFSRPPYSIFEWYNRLWYQEIPLVWNEFGKIIAMSSGPHVHTILQHSPVYQMRSNTLPGDINVASMTIRGEEVPVYLSEHLTENKLYLTLEDNRHVVIQVLDLPM